MRALLSGLTLMTVVNAARAEMLIPAPTKPNEPIAKAFSPTKAAAYLDGVGLDWTRTQACATCHTNVPFMLARPRVQGGDAAPMREVREFLEETVKSWEKEK